jgi:hypothetical protein
MSRLRQYFANRYTSSEATNSEFENVIRYLNSAEIGNYTVGELLLKLFDDSGNVDVGLGLRYNPATGVEFMTDATTQNWTLLVSADDIRGTSGLNVGTIEAPLFSNRVDATAGVSQTVYPYVASGTNPDVLVWVNGVMKAAADYLYSAGASTVTLTVAPATSALVSIATIRTNPAVSLRRVDLVAASGQVTFPFPHTVTEELVVYRNGILQREGGGFDYIKSPGTGTITMTTSQTLGNIITIICISNSAIRDVAGLMLEDKYATNGLINMAAINMPDASLTQAKVNGLVAALGTKAKITVSGSAPLTPATGDLWVNTSYAVPTLLFYDGIRWLSSSPNGMIPLPLPANALQFLRLNSTATALEYSPFDTTGLVQLSQVGAANGVAALNSLGKVPSSNIPDFAQRSPIIGRISGAVVNGSYVVGHIAGNIHAFDSLTAKLTSGTATLQLQVGGVTIGATLGATLTSTKLAITSTASDATSVVKDVVLVVTGAATPVDLTYNIGSLITG